MKKLTIRETRQVLSRLDHILETEGEVTITKRGQAVARVISLRETMSIPSHKDLREKMPRMKKGSEKMVRDDRDAR
ncbi:MAG: type II toxin-antitoxin system prevent-host-death family antitoxin [Thermodesulfovibrionales bacterium]|jgi:prevent-host-death family protein